MKKSDFAGWREVFSFTFSQTVKHKAYGIFLVVFSLIALLSSTGSALVNQYGEMKEREKTFDISQVVIFDETGLNIEYKDVFTGKNYKNLTVVSNPSKTMTEYERQMQTADEKTILVRITFDAEKSLYHALFVQGKKTGVSEESRAEFTNEFCEYFEEAKLEAIRVSREMRDYIQTDIVGEVKILSEDGEIIDKETDSISYEDYFIMLFMLMISFMLINLGGSQIALSIIIEKSSRVMEYLLLNVRPMALIIGKLWATIVTSSLQMIVVGSCYIASPIISNLLVPHIMKLFFGFSNSVESTEELTDEMLAASVKMINGIKFEFVILAVIFVVLGIIFYGLIAGLLGASVSKMDEMQETMVVYHLMFVLGCYADMGLLIMQMVGIANPTFTKVLSICPITSPFWVPGSMILGNMSLSTILASFFAMLVAIILIAILTASVYESLILYNGKALKFKDIIMLAFSKKRTFEKEFSGEENREKGGRQA